ncbi:class I SAM-dependent methyltransferase [Nitrospinota bacterium]
MARTAGFNAQHERYDAWFVHHEAAYHSELLAVRAFLPWQGMGLEVGVGTARFAAPLGVHVGLDPSGEMLLHAARRGVRAVRGIAEALPFAKGIFDYILVVTTICFVDDVPAMMAEAHRVLKRRGEMVIGFIDRDSAIGQFYLAHQAENVFYKEATFHSAAEVENLLTGAGFHSLVWVQTLSAPLEESREIEPLQPGHGRGSFVVVKATRR